MFSDNIRTILNRLSDKVYTPFHILANDIDPKNTIGYYEIYQILDSLRKEGEIKQGIANGDLIYRLTTKEEKRYNKFKEDIIFEIKDHLARLKAINSKYEIKSEDMYNWLVALYPEEDKKEKYLIVKSYFV